ncbi:MAG: family 78 glycoside hydrolase catalytic domain [Oscillospiraceae bacterium]|nr:family 78 glycoside hydrolase catalytic domain [Oscillospiraceae bacterium]
MKAAHLQVEYLNEPLGLGNPMPRFYWTCEGGVTQTAYQIICTRAGKTVWDSGKAESASMTHIPYAGLDLHSRDIVNWSVQLWDENGEPGEISESRFELGLLEASDWTAKWISGDYKPDPKRRYPADCFKKDFSAKDVVKARLYATARGVYDVTVNGKRLEDFILAPGATDYRKRIQVQTYDVTKYIQENNTIELRLADGWFRGSVAAYGVTNVFGTQTSILAQLELTHADGSVQTVITDESWAWSNDGPIRFADLKDGEVYNADMQPSYSGKARVVKAPKGVKLCASDNVPVLEHERFTPTLLPGKVLDFGQTIAGSLAFRVKGKKGQRIRIVCSEFYDQETQMLVRNAVETKPASGWTQQKLILKLVAQKVIGEAVETPLQEILFTCSGGEDVFKTSFTVFGFRYAQVFGDLEFKLEDFTAIAVYSDLEQTGDFTCSDERINQLVKNTRWSMKGNFLDVPTDCPTRERLGWTGDAQVFFHTGAYFMDTAAFFKKWLRDMEDGQYKDGFIGAVAPFSGVEMMYKATGGSVGWADAVYLVPYRFYKRFGDKELLRSCWPMMKKYADTLLKRIEKDGHYEKGVHLGEWLEPVEFRDKVNGAQAKHPEEATAYLYLTMTTMAEIASLLGEPSSDYEKAAERAKAVYPKYAELDTNRQAKLVRPLALGLLDGPEKERAQKRLIRAVEDYRYRVGTGFLSTPFLLDELTKAGASETAYKVLLNIEKPGWLYEVLQGATTIWETWEGYVGKGAVDKGDAGSLNHYSPGAVCQWLFDSCAGIRVDGENHFVIAPIPGGALTHAEANYKSLCGEVRSRWEKSDGSLHYTITIPSNCTAEIRLPGGKTESVMAGTYTFEEAAI